MPKHFDSAQFARARSYLLTKARPLEAALFRYRFEHGDPAAVEAELTRFRNADGGFGHALEADMRAPVSSALATTTALQTLHALGLPAEHPLVRGAVGYLLASYDPGCQSWPLVPPAAESAPHAPWWNQEGLAERFGNFALNPRAEVLGYLYEYGGDRAAELCALLTPQVVAELETSATPITGEEYPCCLRLAQAAGLPDAVRERVIRQLQRLAPSVVTLDPAKWHSYGFLPLQAAPTPASPAAPVLEDAVQQCLDFVIDSQQADGSWSPTWSWFGAFPADWPAAEHDWRGVLALERLLWLQAYGRL